MKARRMALRRAAAQGLGAVCGCLLALLIALSLTIFREGYYIHRLERSNAIQIIYENVQKGARMVAAAAGLREDILDNLVDTEQVYVAVVRRADEIWHGATDQPASPYSDSVTYLQDTVSRETGRLWDEADTALYRNIQLICDDMWRTNAVPPLSNLLNLLMQYRRLVWAPMALLAAALVACLWLQVRFCRGWRQLYSALFGMGTAIALGSVLGMLAINAGGWQNWMPASDAGYGLYYEWFSPLPAMLAACGIGLAGIVWLCALVALVMASRRAAQNTKRSTVEQSGKP